MRNSPPLVVPEPRKSSSGPRDVFRGGSTARYHTLLLGSTRHLRVRSVSNMTRSLLTTNARHKHMCVFMSGQSLQRLFHTQPCKKDTCPVTSTIETRTGLSRLRWARVAVSLSTSKPARCRRTRSCIPGHFLE